MKGSKLLGMTFLRTFLMAYQSIGVVFGDLSMSPLYVYANSFTGKLCIHRNEDVVFGLFSLIFWSLTLFPLLKYTFFLLCADDNGEGGTFALYSLLCRHAKFSLLPNQQAVDEELTPFKYGISSSNIAPSPSSKRFAEKYKQTRTLLLFVVLCGTSMSIIHCVLSPAISVFSSVSGIYATEAKISGGGIVFLASIILVGVFWVQHCGAHKLSFIFTPTISIWLASLFVLGLYNTIYWNPRIVYALSPHYVVKLFMATGKDGWISLGGAVLSVTGSEAIFADRGRFNAPSMRTAFTLFVYPCLVVQYMGQAAYLSRNTSPSFTFYDSVPGNVVWPMILISVFASTVSSEAVIMSTFSLVEQCHALGCFPRIKTVLSSKHTQIYIPEMNWILMIITLSVTLGFRDIKLMGNAYAISCAAAMLITTCLFSLVILFLWNRSLSLTLAFLLVFGVLDLTYLTASFAEIAHGGWLTALLCVIFMAIMYTWNYGCRGKYGFDVHNRVSMKWLLGLGPSLGIVRVPGIGIIYSELVISGGVPSIFSHFITNLPAFHEVLVFVCVKSVPVPYVPPAERFLVGRVCPRPFHMYRCTVRYGYKDLRGEESDFEGCIVRSIAEFVQMDAAGRPQPSGSDDGSSLDGRMAVIASVVGSERREWSSEGVTGAAREEVEGLMRAKEAGVAYIMGHSYVKARRSSSFVKKMMIDVGYSFLRKNCRGPTVTLNIPRISLIEVGMMYHI